MNIPAYKRHIISTPRKKEREASIPLQSDTGKHLHTLVNGITGNIEGKVSLAAIPSLHALLKLEEMSIDECGRALKAGDLSEIVVVRPMIELNSSSLLDEAVLEETKAALNARSESSILKDPN